MNQTSPLLHAPMVSVLPEIKVAAKYQLLCKAPFSVVARDVLYRLTPFSLSYRALIGDSFNNTASGVAKGRGKEFLGV